MLWIRCTVCVRTKSTTNPSKRSFGFNRLRTLKGWVDPRPGREPPVHVTSGQNRARHTIDAVYTVLPISGLSDASSTRNQPTLNSIPATASSSSSSSAAAAAAAAALAAVRCDLTCCWLRRWRRTRSVAAASATLCSLV